MPENARLDALTPGLLRNAGRRCSQARPRTLASVAVATSSGPGTRYSVPGRLSPPAPRTPALGPRAVVGSGLGDACVRPVGPAARRARDTTCPQQSTRWERDVASMLRSRHVRAHAYQSCTRLTSPARCTHVPGERAMVPGATSSGALMELRVVLRSESVR